MRAGSVAPPEPGRGQPTCRLLSRWLLPITGTAVDLIALLPPTPAPVPPRRAVRQIHRHVVQFFRQTPGRSRSLATGQYKCDRRDPIGEEPWLRWTTRYS